MFFQRMAQVFPAYSVGGLNWSTLFYCRMKAAQDIIPYGKVQHLAMCLEEFCNPESQAFPQFKENMEMVKEMQTYVETHTQDLDNCLLGQKTPVSFATEVLRDKEEQRKQSPFKTETADLTSTYLLDLMQGWAAQPPSENNAVAEKLRAFTQHIDDSVRVLHRGALLLVRHSGPAKGTAVDAQHPLRFARLVEDARVGQPLRLTFHPYESDAVSVPRSAFVLLPTNVLAHVTSVKAMERLVEDSGYQVFQALITEIQNLADVMLEKQHVSTRLVHRAQQNDVTFFDRAALEHLRDVLDDTRLFRSNEFAALMLEVSTVSQKTLRNFMSKVEAGEITVFPATQDTQQQQLSHTDFSGYLKNTLKAYLGWCQCALEMLQMQRRELCNGNMKKDTTDWYLKRIKDDVNEFLAKAGYDFDAVPANYLEEKPSNVEAVRKNLQIVQSALSGEGTKVLVETLRKEIYARLDHYVLNMQAYMCEELNIAPDTFTVEEAERRFAALPETGSGQNKLISDLIKDIKYTIRMKYLDDTPSEKGGLDVVPVSGLILGRLCRFENELKTACQAWDIRLPPPPAAVAATSSIAIPTGLSSAALTPPVARHRPQPQPPLHSPPPTHGATIQPVPPARVQPAPMPAGNSVSNTSSNAGKVAQAVAAHNAAVAATTVMVLTHTHAHPNGHDLPPRSSSFIL
eukprot:TRINITY_DN4243_c0_g1_i1.p1 TRINITY_DN4243_c0_g1~~TRINITY_DN4243_c0_g1_i1.p1  ORF type:complete len:685 (+),score=175.86 TRINITY_DN4243_c0_g1_i1:212-2266(+)